MPSAWIERRTTRAGVSHYRVSFRTGGRESSARSGGTFKTKADAQARLRWITGELAACRVPTFTAAPSTPVTVRAACVAWQASRIDVAESTRVLHRVALGRILPILGDRDVVGLTPSDVALAVAALAGADYARGSISKSLNALAQALDHAGIDPNPARDRGVKLPREDRAEIVPPTADQVERALFYVAPKYRLPLMILEACALRVGELEHLRWADVDEPTMRVRISRATAKTRKPRWVQVPADLFAMIIARVPREDRDLEDLVFPGATQERMRTDLGRACKAAGVASFGLHDLRHRRLSLWHREGVPIAEVAQRAGHSRSSMTLDVYSHVLIDAREVDRALILSA